MIKNKQSRQNMKKNLHRISTKKRARYIKKETANKRASIWSSLNRGEDLPIEHYRNRGENV